MSNLFLRCGIVALVVGNFLYYHCLHFSGVIHELLESQPTFHEDTEIGEVLPEESRAMKNALYFS